MCLLHTTRCITHVHVAHVWQEAAGSAAHLSEPDNELLPLMSPRRVRSQSSDSDSSQEDYSVYVRLAELFEKHLRECRYLSKADLAMESEFSMQKCVLDLMWSGVLSMPSRRAETLLREKVRGYPFDAVGAFMRKHAQDIPQGANERVASMKSIYKAWKP